MRLRSFSYSAEKVIIFITVCISDLLNALHLKEGLFYDYSC